MQFFKIYFVKSAVLINIWEYHVDSLPGTFLQYIIETEVNIPHCRIIIFLTLQLLSHP